MQVRGKTLRCFSVILAFSKSLHETCRLLRALHTFFFLQAVYLGLTLCMKYFLFTENQEQCLNPVWHQASAQPDACMIDQ